MGTKVLSHAVGQWWACWIFLVLVVVGSVLWFLWANHEQVTTRIVFESQFREQIQQQFPETRFANAQEDMDTIIHLELHYASTPLLFMAALDRSASEPILIFTRVVETCDRNDICTEEYIETIHVAPMEVFGGFSQERFVAYVETHPWPVHALSVSELSYEGGLFQYNQKSVIGYTMLTIFLGVMALVVGLLYGSTLSGCEFLITWRRLLRRLGIARV